MQAGAVLLSKHVTGDGVPVAGRLNDVKFKRMIRPGDTILIETALDERMGDAFFLSAKVTCDGKLAVTLNFAVTRRPKREADSKASDDMDFLGLSGKTLLVFGVANKKSVAYHVAQDA